MVFQRASRFFAAIVIFAAALAACHHDGTSAPAGPETPLDTLKDPNTCANCHVQHFTEWSGSMHAYAGVDPIFLAMQARGQRETNGALGTFCVNCHAPMAVRDGLTTDGSNLASLDPKELGVTCYFCHSVASVTGSHNNALTLASDGVMRADITNPLENNVHPSMYSALHDETQPAASSLCGACHDVDNQQNVAIESSYAEWQQSLFAKLPDGGSESFLTCQGCHMEGSNDVAANVPNAPQRRVHNHGVPAVDLATIPFAGTDTQQIAVQNKLDPSIVAQLCVRPPQEGDTVQITLDNAAAGHNFPSGAAHDRRAWLEVIAYQGTSVVYQSGVVADGIAVTATTDPDIWLFDEQLTDSSGQPTHFMWNAASTNLVALPFSVTNDPTDPAYHHAKVKTYPVPVTADKITMRLRIIPFGVDVLSDLVASGDLDAQIAAKITPFSLAGTTLSWTSDIGYGCVPSTTGLGF